MRSNDGINLVNFGRHTARPYTFVGSPVPVDKASRFIRTRRGLELLDECLTSRIDTLWKQITPVNLSFAVAPPKGGSHNPEWFDLSY